MLTKHLRTLRHDAGFTQHELARKTGIPRWKIADAELGVRKLLPEEAETIRRVLLDSAQKKSARLFVALDDLGRASKNIRVSQQFVNKGD